MAFSVGFSSVQKLNIRNLYSANDLPANEIMCRKMETPAISSQKAAEIVKRLCQPRVFPEERNNKRRKIERKEDNAIYLQTKKESELDNMMKTGSSFKEQRKHVKRVSHPTVSSTIRQKLYQGRNDHLSEMITSCERLVLQLSQRYYPLAYRNWLKLENLRGIKTDFKDYHHFSK
ncbi:Hypothetical predicted protein [Mytilus galloprovincialis]|uniref:Uncharacterized protein n=1 Tax=Mytilus galloprovincialis TaxID=29158 RepID=A0A8B6FLM5_MYTGA|nr:Hypothetical predicted protein [Mytilus galloprovincialis]